MNRYLANPAPQTGLFIHQYKIGRLARVGNCETAGDSQGSVKTCDLIGVPAGTTASLQLMSVGPKLQGVSLSVQNNIKNTIGLTAMTSMLAEGALIESVDPNSQHRGISVKTQEELILSNIKSGQSINADGLNFTQTFIMGNLVFSVSPSDAN